MGAISSLVPCTIPRSSVGFAGTISKPDITQIMIKENNDFANYFHKLKTLLLENLQELIFVATIRG